MNPFEIQVWAQMFFPDGSVSEGRRVPAEIYENPELLSDVIASLLKSVNRPEGFLVVWGAGDIKYGTFAISLEGSDSSASSS